jgi:hypothetical protein
MAEGLKGLRRLYANINQGKRYYGQLGKVRLARSLSPNG